MTPSEIIIKRNEAFSRGDFGFIFDSYHSESNFRRQFLKRDDYIQIGKTSLSQDFQIMNCVILDESIEDSEAQVVFFMEMQAEGQPLKFAELVWFRCENGDWRYHRGLKMTQDQLPDNPEKLTFADFSKLDHSTVF